MPPQIEDDDMAEGFWKNVTKYGLGTVGFVVLGYFMLTDVRADQKATRAEHASMVTAVQSAKASVDAVANIAGQSDMAQQQILYVLQTMCTNQARTDDQRENCLRRIDTRTR